MNLNDIQEMLNGYIAAEKAVLQGKSITFNGQQMTMENLSEIRKGRQEWARELATATAASRRSSPFKLARFS